MNTKKIFRLTKTLNIAESLVEEPEEVDENDCNQRTILNSILDQIRNRGERYSKLFPKRRVLEIPDESWSIQLSEDSESTAGSNNQSHRSRSNVSIDKVTSTPQRDFTKPYNDSLRLSIIPYGSSSPNSSRKRLPNSSKKGSSLKGKRAKLNEASEVIGGEEENAFVKEDRSGKSSKANMTRCSNCASRMQESTVMSTFVERPSLLPPHLQTTIMDTSPYMSPLMSGETTVLPQRKSTVKQNKTHGATILRETQTQTSAGTSPFEKTMLNKTRPSKRTRAPSAYHYTSLKDKLFNTDDNLQSSSDAAEKSEIEEDEAEEEIQFISDSDYEKGAATEDRRSVSSSSEKSSHSSSTLQTDVLGLIISVCDKVGSPKVAKAVATEKIEKAVAAEPEKSLTSSNHSIKNISKRRSSAVRNVTITEEDGKLEDPPAKDTTIEHSMDSSQSGEKSQGNNAYHGECSMALEGTINCEPGSSLELFSSIDGSESEQMIAAESTSVSALDQEPLKFAQETSSPKEQVSGKSSSSLSLCEQKPENPVNSSVNFNSTMNEEEEHQILNGSSINSPASHQFSGVKSEADVESTDLLESSVQRLETPKLKENVANVQKPISTKKQSKMTTIDVVPYIKGNTPGKLDAQAKTLFDITLSPDQSRAILEKSVKVASPAEVIRQEDQPQGSHAQIDQLQDPQEQEVENEEDGHQEQEVKPSVSRTKGKVKPKTKPQKKAKKAALQSSADISMDKTKSLIIPDSPPEPGIRRSNRTRVKPCDFWRNERPIYVRDEEGLGYKIVGVDKGFKANATLCCKPNARKMMKVARGEEGQDVVPSQSRSKAPQDLSIHVHKDMAENATRLQKLQDLGLIVNKQVLKWNSSLFSGGKVQMAIIEKKSGDACGLLKISGFGKKPLQETGDYVTQITILHGVCQVYIGEYYGVLKSTDIFTVPPKTEYSVENLRRDEAELMFFEKKN